MSLDINRKSVKKHIKLSLQVFKETIFRKTERQLFMLEN